MDIRNLTRWWFAPRRRIAQLRIDLRKVREYNLLLATENHKLETEMNIEIDDHKIALLVNAITAELKPFTKTQSLRARVSGIVLEHLKPKAGTSCGRSANSAMARFEDSMAEVDQWLYDEMEKWHRDKCQDVYSELASKETPHE